jgi:phosphotransacetylase
MSVLPNPPRRSGKLPRVVLCESFDQRVVRAAHVLNQHKLAQVVLLGDYEELERVAVGYRTDLAGIDVLNYEGEEIQTQIQAQLAALGLTDRLDATDPVVAGAWLVRNGLADAVVAGAATTPTHVMRVYLRLLGVAEGCQTVSGLSLVSFENCEFVRSPVVGLADVSVVPEPSVAQLADIAIQSAASYERMTGEGARVAFLSFSTHGSSAHPAARRIQEAVALTRERKPELLLDGEMQLDAALIPAVAGTKSPTSAVAGNANVLVFPSLDAGNIAVKIFQKFSQCRVLGPVLQGMRYPGTYIPRASSTEDILDQVRLLTS